MCDVTACCDPTNCPWQRFRYAALILILVASLGEVLGRPGGIVHRAPVDLQDSAGLLHQVTAGELLVSYVSDRPSLYTPTGLFNRVLP